MSFSLSLVDKGVLNDDSIAHSVGKLARRMPLTRTAHSTHSYRALRSLTHGKVDKKEKRETQKGTRQCKDFQISKVDLV